MQKDPTPAELEKMIVERLQRFWDLSQSRDPRDGTKLEDLNKEIKELLRRNGTRKEVLEYGFPGLSKEMAVATSPDGKLRFYSWDDMSGGTMRFHEKVVQFVGSDGKVRVIVEDPDRSKGGQPFFHQIFQMEVKDGPLYFGNFTMIASTSLNAQAIEAMKIDGNKLKREVKVFETEEGLSGELWIEYDFFTVVDRKERPIRLFEFDPETKTLRHPYIDEEIEGHPGQGKVTDKWVTYKFTDGRFRKVDKEN
ncbi:MAG: hypothetical protein IPM63_18040 [Acidobacteriota bacterium]|nr:MAG: hypothetical protein IPM63_18040 [Acidobacteriota bacterium]